MLYPNGVRSFNGAGTHVSGSFAASGSVLYSGIRGARFNRYVSDVYSPVIGAVPSGYGAKAYIFAVQSGGLAAYSDLRVDGSATGGLGLPGEGSSSLTFMVDDATGQLISSGNGTATFTFSSLPLLLTASLGGTGSSTFAITTNVPLLGAQANAIATTTVTFNGTLVPYAVGSLAGSTIDTTTLTAASLLAAMNASPPAVNIKKVNDVPVNGTGTTGDEWGP